MTTTTKPYLIRAIWEWCTDQGLTPYLAVAVSDRTRVPREFVRDGQIVLNVSAEATHKLQLGNEEITFQARFGGQPFPISVPIGNVAAIYARENGQGMAFEPEEAAAEPEAVPDDSEVVASDVASGTEPVPDATKPSPGGRPHLTRIK